MRILGWLLLAVPLAFGAIRFATTNWADARYLLMAAFALLVSRNVLRATKEMRVPVVFFMVLSTLSAAVATGVVGFMLGGRSLVSLAVMSLGFGLCCSAGWTLVALGRTRS